MATKLISTDLRLDEDDSYLSSSSSSFSLGNNSLTQITADVECSNTDNQNNTSHNFSTNIDDWEICKILGEGAVLLHPFVLGELLLNGLPKHGPFSQESLEEYAPAPVASSLEVASFIQWAKLAGTGIGYVDSHLLVSARLLPHGTIMTLDNDLRAQAERFEMAYEA